MITQPKNSTVVEGTYKEIPIAVEVPTTGTAQINPYGLPVTDCYIALGCNGHAGVHVQLRSALVLDAQGLGGDPRNWLIC